MPPSTWLVPPTQPDERNPTPVRDIHDILVDLSEDIELPTLNSDTDSDYEPGDGAEVLPLSPGQPISKLPIRSKLAYASHILAKNALNEMAIPRGFTIAGAKASAPGRGMALFVCSRSFNSDRKVQDSLRSTSKTGCPFRVQCRRASKDEIEEEDRWFLKVIEDLHNHPAESRQALAIARRFDETSKDLVREMVHMGVKPRAMVKKLRREGQAVTTMDVYRRIKAMKDEDMDGLSSGEAAIKAMDDRQDIYHAWLDQDHRIKGLLLSAHDNAALTRRFGNVLMIDATYQTNVYKMPMLHIVALSGTHQAISAAYIWMPCEREWAYKAALGKFKELVLLGEDTVRVVVTDRDEGLRNAVRYVWPGLLDPRPEGHGPVAQVLCQYHIIMNVNARGRKGTGITEDVWTEVMQHWKNKVLYAKTAQGAKDGLADLKAEYNDPAFNQLYSYLHSLRPIECFFMTHWLNLLPTEGITTTSPCEGSHAAFKRALGSASVGFFTLIRLAKEEMSHHVDRLLDEYLKQATRPRQGMPASLDILARQLTRHALGLLVRKGNKADKYETDYQAWMELDASVAMERDMPDMGVCSKTFRGKYDLPCAHELHAALYGLHPRPVESLRYGAKWKLHDRAVFDGWFSEGRQLYTNRVWEVRAGVTGPVAIRNPPLQFNRTTYRNQSGSMRPAAIPSSLPAPPIELAATQITNAISTQLDTRPRAASGRILSQSEIVARAEDPAAHKKPRRCGCCKQEGHDKRSCATWKRIKAAVQAEDFENGAVDESLAIES